MTGAGIIFNNVLKMAKLPILFIIILSLFLIGCTQYDYEVCNDNVCKRVQLINPVQPSLATERICVPDFEEAKQYGARQPCEDVPINRLLLKGGTNKIVCNGKGIVGGSTFVDNYWNSEGLIDGCEMPPKSSMSFIFKQHDQSVRNHTGTIQINIHAINYDNDYKALQVFTGEDNNNDNLPDSWIHCGNVDGITRYSTKIIQCKGTNLKFIKLVNAEWNKGNLYIDNVEVLRGES